MGRLTVVPNDGRNAGLRGFCTEQDAINRLAAYEDTGLEPAEIEIANKVIVSAFNLAANSGTDMLIERFKEIIRAEAEGRLVVLPCKVGDTLYEIDLPEYGVIVCKVMWMILKNDVSVQVEVTDGHGLGSGYCFELSDFGKTVFRTRKEAEAKLKTLQNT